MAAAVPGPEATSAEGAVVSRPCLGLPGGPSELEPVGGGADQLRIHNFFPFLFLTLDLDHINNIDNIRRFVKSFFEKN